MEITTEKKSEQIAAILAAVASGASLTYACKLNSMRPIEFHRNINSLPALREAFAAAAEAGADAMADHLLTAHEDIPNLGQARLYSSNVKWLLARRFAARYGEKSFVDHTVTVDLSAALQAARQRLVRPMCDPEQAVIDVTPEKTDTYSEKSSDSISVSQVEALLLGGQPWDKKSGEDVELAYILS